MTFALPSRKLIQPQRHRDTERTKRKGHRYYLPLCLRRLCGYDFGRTFCPSFKSTGGLTIKSSPPVSPFEIVTPCCDFPDTCTWRRTALPSTTMKTAPSRTVEEGVVINCLSAGA